MGQPDEPVVWTRRGLRPREWCVLGTTALFAGLTGAAVGYPGPGWVWSVLAAAIVGTSAAVVVVLGLRRGVRNPALGLLAGGVAALEGWVVGYLNTRGDSEVVDALIGTTAMAIVLGLVCAALTGVLLLDDDPEDR